MATSWTIAPQVDITTAGGRLRARRERTRAWSRVAVHVAMLTIVLSVTVGVTLLTAGATVAWTDALHETFASFDWPSLDGIEEALRFFILCGSLGDVTIG